MDRVALYGEQGRNPELEAFAAGWGRVAWRHPHFWRGEVEGFGLVVLGSLQGNNAAILDAYRSRGIPVLVIDLGYIRGRGHYQVSLNGLNQIVPFACPADRWNALGLSVAASGGDPSGYTLVAAQRPCDTSHGLSADDYRAWLAAQDGRIRLHPVEAVPERSLAEDLAGARMLKTLCSGSGIEALIAGVPAVADMPERAVWGELSGATLPSAADRVNLLSRIAYGQWTLEEMRSGECAAFVRDHLLPNIPIAGIGLPFLGNVRIDSVRGDEGPEVILPLKVNKDGSLRKKRGRPRKVIHADH